MTNTYQQRREVIEKMNFNEVIRIMFNDYYLRSISIQQWAEEHNLKVEEAKKLLNIGKDLYHRHLGKS